MDVASVFQNVKVKIFTQSVTIKAGGECSLQTSLIMLWANCEASIVILVGVKCTILENQSTIVRMASYPCVVFGSAEEKESGNSGIISMVMSAYG